MYGVRPGNWYKLAHRSWRRAAVALALLGGLSACHGGAAASDLPAYATDLPTEHFVFYYDPGQPGKDPGQTGDAQAVALAAEDAFRRIRSEEKLDFEPTGRIPVIIYRTHAEFLREANANRTPFVVGTASSADNAIRLDGSKALAMPDKVVGHEVAHIFLFRMLGDNVGKLPLWMNEGLAQVLGGEDPRRAKATVESALYEERLPELTSLAEKFPNSENGSGLAYAQSQHAVDALLERGGWTNMRALLARLKNGSTFDAAMRDVYGISAVDWDAEWMRTLRSEARRSAWVRWASWLVPVLMFIALGWGTLTVRGKRKRQAEEEAEPVGELEPPTWWREDEFRR